MRAFAFVLLALALPVKADNLFQQTDSRSRSVDALIYLTEDNTVPVCYGARCWLSNGRDLGYRYLITAQLQGVPTCMAGRGDCPEVFLKDEDAFDAQQPLSLN